jgi:hypothetical protein
MQPETRKQVGKWGRDLIISVIIVPAILTYLQMSPLVVAIAGIYCLFVLISWENWDWFSARLIRKAPVGVGLFAIMLSTIGWYYSHYSATPLWVSVEPPPMVISPPPLGGVTPPPSEAPPLPQVPIQSRLNRIIFVCDMAQPLKPEDETKQIDQFKSRMQGWAATLGLDVSFPELKDGIQVTIEAKTVEAKAKFAQWGIVPEISKLIGEARWIEGRHVVVVHADLPKAYRIAVGSIWRSPNSASYRPSASTAGFPTNNPSSRKSPPGSTTAMPTTPRPTGTSQHPMHVSNSSTFTLQSE